jgi:hypothetical protein
MPLLSLNSAESQGYLQQVVTVIGEHYVVVIIAAAFLAAIEYIRRRGLGAVNGLLRAVPVNGEWKTEIDRGSGFQAHEDATVHQFMNSVWGNTTIKTGTGKTYNLRGRICGQMLCLVYTTSKGGAGFDAGAVVLEIDPEGNEMAGFEVGYDKEKKDIATRPYKWTRR